MNNSNKLERTQKINPRTGNIKLFDSQFYCEPKNICLSEGAKCRGGNFFKPRWLGLKNIIRIENKYIVLMSKYNEERNNLSLLLGFNDWCEPFLDFNLVYRVRRISDNKLFLLTEKYEKILKIMFSYRNRTNILYAAFASAIEYELIQQYPINTWKGEKVFILNINNRKYVFYALIDIFRKLFLFEEKVQSHFKIFLGEMGDGQQKTLFTTQL